MPLLQQRSFLFRMSEYYSAELEFSNEQGSRVSKNSKETENRIMQLNSILLRSASEFNIFEISERFLALSNSYNELFLIRDKYQTFKLRNSKITAARVLKIVFSSWNEKYKEFILKTREFYECLDNLSVSDLKELLKLIPKSMLKLVREKGLLFRAFHFLDFASQTSSLDLGLIDDLLFPNKDENFWANQPHLASYFMFLRLDREEYDLLLNDLKNPVFASQLKRIDFSDGLDHLRDHMKYDVVWKIAKTLCLHTYFGHSKLSRSAKDYLDASIKYGRSQLNREENSDEFWKTMDHLASLIFAFAVKSDDFAYIITDAAFMSYVNAAMILRELKSLPPANQLTLLTNRAVLKKFQELLLQGHSLPVDIFRSFKLQMIDCIGDDADLVSLLRYLQSKS
jgi:hypothetical protein